MSLEVLPNLFCPLCGQPNDCAAAKSGQHDVNCWCAKTSFNPKSLALIPAELKHKACLCQQCAQQPPEANERACQQLTWP